MVPLCRSVIVSAWPIQRAQGFELSVNAMLSREAVSPRNPHVAAAEPVKLPRHSNLKSAEFVEDVATRFKALGKEPSKHNSQNKCPS
jgi:hypothetical protein